MVDFPCPNCGQLYQTGIVPREATSLSFLHEKPQNPSCQLRVGCLRSDLPSLINARQVSERLWYGIASGGEIYLQASLSQVGYRAEELAFLNHKQVSAFQCKIPEWAVRDGWESLLSPEGLEEVRKDPGLGLVTRMLLVPPTPMALLADLDVVDVTNVITLKRLISFGRAMFTPIH
jgi:hypothetical protein